MKIGDFATPNVETLKFLTFNKNTRLSFVGTLWAETRSWAQILVVLAETKTDNGSKVDLPITFVFMSDLKEESYIDVFITLNSLIRKNCPYIEKSRQKIDSVLTVSDSEKSLTNAIAGMIEKEIVVKIVPLLMINLLFQLFLTKIRPQNFEPPETYENLKMQLLSFKNY